MIADRYITAASLAPEALLQLWRSLPACRQEAIGTVALLNVLAETVASDDGLVTTEADRAAAITPAHEGIQYLYDTVQAEMPEILWHYPEAYRYEVRDEAGELVGTVETVRHDIDCAAESTQQFCPTSPMHEPGLEMRGEPSACLPDWIRAIVADGGWFGAMLPDGRRYPDDFRPVDGARQASVIDDGARALGSRPVAVPRPDMPSGQFPPIAQEMSRDEQAAA